jgi:histone-lysine N-methyltransferase SETMAR
LNRNDRDPFLTRIVTCDEKWLLYDNSQRSGQWLDREEKAKKFPKQDLHPAKVQLTVWWLHGGIIHYSISEQGEMINSTRYCNNLRAMNTKLLEKMPSLVNRNGVILLHDNARPHVSFETLHTLNELKYEVIALEDFAIWYFFFWLIMTLWKYSKAFSREAASKMLRFKALC